ncbi:Uncharacterised protein [Burkholderia pseudomallei]|nr:Uncharacterised protein [Burkholderia pseudomallei]
MNSLFSRASRRLRARMYGSSKVANARVASKPTMPSTKSAKRRSNSPRSTAPAVVLAANATKSACRALSVRISASLELSGSTSALTAPEQKMPTATSAARVSADRNSVFGAITAGRPISAAV